jgi:SNF2 family DNA or RNA helicase|tara:strand:- start:148 stop:1593 length:1446 start_codon:yes stop_codon:yes gene_type:complete
MKFKYKTKPYEHQRIALERSHDKINYGYFMEMGCGKSKVLIDNMAWLYDQKKIDTAVIVAPKGVYRNWQISEIPAHLREDIEHEVYVWNPNPNKDQQRHLKEGIEERKKLRILLVNVEGFATAKVRKYMEMFVRGSSFLLAVDESTTIKNPKAKRTKALVAIGKSASFRRILTGSPVTKSPMDLYSQCGFMDTRLLGHDSYYSFQGRYAITRTQRMGSHSFQQIVGYRNLEELSTKLDSFSYRVTKEEALDLPAKIYTVREVNLNDEQRQYYMSLKKAAIVLLNDGELVSAPAVMTQLLRLQQVLCGHLKTDDGDLVEFKTNRMAALLETVEEMSGKVIIWSRFRYDIKKITEELKKVYGCDSTVNYFGDTSDADRQDAIRKFQFEDARFFVANPQTAGFGLTLTAATNVIYYANDFNLETRIQSEDRCHRIGQHHPVTYVDLVTRGSIDEYIVRSLRAKIDLSAKTLGEEVRQWLEVSPR